MKIYAIHGTLGSPADWDSLGLNLEKVDLFQRWTKPLKLWEWAADFNASVEEGERNVLMGYSLGGRLALHALIQNPDLWAGAVIISSHPGLKSAAERMQRIQTDKDWAHRLKTDSWENFMQAWNQQDVLLNTPQIHRDEKTIPKEVIGKAMLNWSLGMQEDLQPALAELHFPILWVAGENDAKYAKIAGSIQLHHPQSQVWLCKGSGHRVPWEKPDLFKKALNDYLEVVNGVFA